MHMHRSLCQKLSLFLCIIFYGSSSFALEPASDTIQTAIIRLYSNKRCDGVRQITQKVDPQSLRPNVLAIVAYCEPTNQDPEKLFALAEEKSPTGDLILVLHARYRWKKNPASSEPIWHKVLMTARNIYFQDLAKSYLAGVVSTEDNDKPLDLSPHTAFTQIMIGATHKDHPQINDFSFVRTEPTFGTFFQGKISYRTWYPFGSVGYLLDTQYEQFFSTHHFNFWDTRLEVPVAIHVQNAKDIIFSPVFGYQSLGGNPYEFFYGLGVKGAVYRSDYVQSVQALIYTNRIFDKTLATEGGAHYRFEYDWDFYPDLWFISTLFAIEHVSSDTAIRYFGNDGLFEMSHNDLILEFKFDRNFSKCTLGFEPQVKYRLDSNPSVYINPADLAPTSKKREDWEITLNWNASIPILTNFKIYTWYEWTKNFSNLGAGDYLNRNFTNQTIGLALRTSLSSY